LTIKHLESLSLEFLLLFAGGEVVKEGSELRPGFNHKGGEHYLPVVKQDFAIVLQ
jgi:hypothetical protein